MSEGEVISLDLPASHKYLSVLAAWLAAALEKLEEPDQGSAPMLKADFADFNGCLPAQARTAYDITLAAHEVCTNIIDHAYAGQTGGRIRIHLAWERRHRRLVIEMCDAGQSFDPSQVPEPDFERGQIHGYGLFLVHQLMDEVTYESQPGGNCWRLVKNL